MIHQWVHTSVAQQVAAGPGALQVLADMLKALGMRRVVLVTTAGRLESEGGERVQKALGRSLVTSFDQVGATVSTDSVQAGVRLLRGESIDGLVSLGGGSAVDTAKALAFFAEHESGAPAAGFADRPMLPQVAIPTTLVGAAFSSSFSMVDPQSRRSSTAGAPTMVPAAVVIEPELSADLPMSLLAGSIASATAHAVESLWLPGRTPESEALAVGGLERLARALSVEVGEPGDIEHRSALIDAAVLCGRARQQAGDGLHHVLVQLIAARAEVAYGAVHAALLGSTARFTLDAVPEAAASIDRALGDAGGDTGERLDTLIGALGPRRGLDELGVSDDDLDAVARQSGSHRAVQYHPRPVGEADVRALLSDAW